MPHLVTRTGISAICAALDDHQRAKLRQDAYRYLGVGLARQLAGFTLVGREDVNQPQQVHQTRLPQRGGDVLAVDKHLTAQLMNALHQVTGLQRAVEWAIDHPSRQLRLDLPLVGYGIWKRIQIADKTAVVLEAKTQTHGAQRMRILLEQTGIQAFALRFLMDETRENVVAQPRCPAAIYPQALQPQRSYVRAAGDNFHRLAEQVGTQARHLAQARDDHVAKVIAKQEDVAIGFHLG